MDKVLWYYPVYHIASMRLVGFLKSPFPEIFDKHRVVFNFPVVDVVVDVYQAKDPNLWCM